MVGTSWPRIFQLVFEVRSLRRSNGPLLNTRRTRPVGITTAAKIASITSSETTPPSIAANLNQSLFGTAILSGFHHARQARKPPRHSSDSRGRWFRSRTGSKARTNDTRANTAPKLRSELTRSLALGETSSTKDPLCTSLAQRQTVICWVGELCPW